MMRARMLRWLLGASACVCAETVSAQTGPMLHYSLDFEVSATDFVDTIKIEWQRHQVYVPVVIDGKVLRFLLDTGAGQTVVFDDAPIRGAQPAGWIKTLDALGRRDSVPVVTLPPMQIGSERFTGCRAIVQHRVVRRQTVDGILGFDIFAKGLCAKIDVRAGILVLTDRRRFFDVEGGAEVKYKLKYHTPYLRVNPFGRYREQACFDTGSRQVYAINYESFRQGEERTRPEMVSPLIEGRCTGRYAMGHSGTERLGEVLFLHFPQFYIGTLPLCDLHTLTTQGTSHVGAGVLEHCAVIINPHRRRLIFQPYEGYDRVVVDNRQTEIAFVADRGLPVVGLVWEQGIPYQQGFRVGDVIIRIDGRPVNDFSSFALWPYEQGREYTFTVYRNDGQHDLRWVRLPKE